MIIDIDPRVDIVFKKLFGSPEHANLTMSFVNAMLNAAGLSPAVSLSIQNPFTLAEFKNEKDIELDILYQDENGTDVQLEMQITAHTGLPQRMLHNWSQVYTRQIAKGQDYKRHRPVVSIWIIDDTLSTDGNWIHAFRCHCPLTGYLLHEDLCIITIELPCWLALMEGRDRSIFDSKDKWLFFMTHAFGEESVRLLETLADPEYSEALEIMEKFNKSQQMRHYYQMRENYTHIIASYQRTGYEEGLAKGLADGLAEGLAEGLAKGKAAGLDEGKAEIVRKLKISGMPVAQIAALCGLSEQEILGI